jgi:hypothetical protein
VASYYQAKDEVERLVERFSHNYKAYTSPDYNETELRIQFVNPFFESLGWDMSNVAGRHEVFHEDRVEVEEGGKRKPKHPDYGFRIDGQVRFYVEAKKPYVKLKTDRDPAFQLRRYGWSRKLTASVLTDFEEFIIYDCRVPPDQNDEPHRARLEYYQYTDYISKWDEIVGLFSREAVLDNRLDEWVRGKKARGTVGVDDAFLKEMEGWREGLAMDIALHNPGLTQRQINMAVQTTIDRIVFLRICEDRQIEGYGRLEDTARGRQVYTNLTQLFRQADAKYNSGLFHFSDEVGREDPDTLTLKLTISDDILQDIISRLYYPVSPYEFSVLPGDILGQIYERFLGKVIELTPGGGATVEEKPEVRKAGGVYYTPTYIVDYIVQNTVGKLVEGKTPDEIGKLKILDPACGSGSFLISAFQYLIDWHLAHYLAHEPAKHVRAKRLRIRPFAAGVKQERAGEVGFVLTTAEKKRILLNNIYGVDLDQQAVEVTKLSLLLKMLEGETAVTTQLELFAERVLPDLENNIKWGNSLIDLDFYEGKQISMFEEEELYRVNVFDWHSKTDGFGTIMANGGFDAVIGNPPYLRIQGLQEFYGSQINYFASKYRSAVKRFDLYLLFAERGFRLLKQAGYLGFIFPHKFINSDFGSGLRQFLIDNRALEKVVNFGNNLIFKQASTYTGIFLLRKIINEEFYYYEFPNLSDLEISPQLRSLTHDNFTTYSIGEFTSQPWTLTNRASGSLLTVLNRQRTTLNDVTDEILVGVQSGIDNVHILEDRGQPKNGKLTLYSERANADIEIEAGLVKPFLMGEDVHRYQVPVPSHYVIYPYYLVAGKTKILEENELREQFPLGYSYLREYQSELREIRERQKTNSKYWYSCHRSRDMRIFESNRIVSPEISLGCNMTVVPAGIYHNTKCYSIVPSSRSESINYWLGLLNSKIMWWFLSNTGYVLRGGYFVFKTNYLKPFPIRTINFDNPVDKNLHNRVVSLVETMLNVHKQLVTAPNPQSQKTIQSVIENTDRKIDELAYELYGLSENEIALVEAGS